MHNNMGKELMVTMTREELRQTIRETVQEVTAGDRQGHEQAPEQSEKLLTRVQCASRLQVSLVTLDKWTNEGIIPGYRIGFRKLYKESEIIESLEAIQAQKYAR
jgi:hypothetical protein